MPEKNQRIGLPVPGTYRSPKAVVAGPGSRPSASVPFLTASVDLVAIAASPPFHAATFPLD